MKSRIPSLSLAVVAGVSLLTPAFAEVNIEYVTVGNAGNAADTADGDSGIPGIQNFGAVAYEYKIGKYEVTIAQYAQFLNAKGASNSNGIYNPSMANYGITQNGSSGSFTYSVSEALSNRPVVEVSWYDAARFCNWLGNGQGDGDMEDGAYTLTGNTGIISVNPGATVHLPSEDEWYKAAYYNGNTLNYSIYPNGEDSFTTADANYDNSVGVSTDVGSYPDDPSFYGTFDQGGNVWEWNDAVISSTSRGLRGGAWNAGVLILQSSDRNFTEPVSEYLNAGFRVVRVDPELKAEVATAIELYFPSVLGKSYLIEESPDLSTWTPLESGIAGTDGEIVRLYSTRNVPKRFLRVSEEAP